MVSEVELIDYNFYNPIKNGTYRPGQREAIEQIIKAYESGRKVIELDIPTSGGKTLSLIAAGNILIHEYGFGRIIYTSPQVSLIRTGELFGLPKLVGRANYPCIGSEDFIAAGMTADDCPFTARDDGFKACGGCPYRKAKAIFKDACFGATTFSRAQIDPQILKTMEGIVIDESTELFNKLIESASLEVSKEVARSDNLYEALGQHKMVLKHQMETIKTNCMNMQSENERAIGKKKLSKDALLKKVKRFRKEYRRTKRDMEACDRAMRYIKMGVPHAIVNDKELVYNPVKHKKEPGIVTRFKVLDATLPFREMIMGLKLVILASGTPTTSLLAKPTEYVSIKMKHPIDKSRRMIYYKPIGKMNKDSKMNTIPIMSYEIAELHNFYGRNSIVHCSSYEIAEEFRKNLEGKLDNVICQGQDTKQDDFDKWRASDNSLFLSVMMEQGIDLKGDKYPLNIIAKVNFPNLGNEWIVKRNALDNKKWYNITTALNIVQACGRTTRDPTDYSETYILDLSFYWFYKTYRKLFPEWFHEALVFV